MERLTRTRRLWMASDPHRWRVLAVVATAFFMTILDVSIVNVALPSIGRSLDFSR